MSAQSFRNELATYRERIVGANPKFSGLQLEILDRWRDHASVETIWKTIQSRLPADALPTAWEFISLFLERRAIAERVKVIGHEARHVEAKHLVRTKRHIKNRDYAAVAHENRLMSEFIESNRLLGREKSRGHRKIFVKGWSDKFRELCGDPLDEVVRVLTEIAFGDTETIDAVRGVHRPTTRTKRRSRRD
jgi:hypothetical protein